MREELQTWRNEGLFTPPSLKGTVEIPGVDGGANGEQRRSIPPRV